MNDIIPVGIVLLAIIISVIGIIGCILPVLPGPAISFAALLLVKFATDIPLRPGVLLIFGILALAVTLLDNLLPLYMPARFGSSGWGIAGATAGLIVGLFFPPLGFIVGPFLGAFALEYCKGRRAGDAFVAGVGSFVGFMVGTVVKIGLALAITGWLIVKALIPAVAAL
jgi:uncharacterized protein